jgi:S-ribosylhomocysteine lyase
MDVGVGSFAIDHDRLLRGLYVSRKDYLGKETVTTFDVRIKRPNIEVPIDVPAMHTLEHLMAVYIRSEESGWAERMIYVGPMGCRTGMYIVAKDDLSVEDILPLMQATFQYIAEFEGVVPATVAKECGNYLEHNLTHAKYEAKKYLDEVLTKMKPENMNYPENK